MIKFLFRWAVYGNFWVAGCALAMYFCTIILLNIHIQPSVAFAVFFGTLAVYNFHRIFRLDVLYHGEKSSRHEWIIAHNKSLWFITIFAVLVCGICFIDFYSLPLIITASPAVLVVLLYVMPVFSWSGNKIRLRDLPFIKLFLVAFSWAYVTVVFPLVVEKDNLAFLNESGFYLNFSQRLIFILAITIPFDFRDLELDRKNKVATFANAFGVEVAKNWSVLLLGFFAVLVMLSFLKGDYQLVEMNALVISAFFTGVMIKAADEHQPEWFFSFLLEGTMIDQLFWLALLSFVFG
jgi:4-hydroxybenzoate polyprenyltransferase